LTVLQFVGILRLAYNYKSGKLWLGSLAFLVFYSQIASVWLFDKKS